MRMKLIDDLIDAVSGNEAPAKDVRVGLTWTGVWGKHCGLSRTCSNPAMAHGGVKDIEKLTEKTTLELAEYAKSWNLVEAGIGVAAINSMIKPKGKRGINAIDLIVKKGKGKKVVVVGKFPRLDEVRAAAKELCILELEPNLINPEEGVLPSTAAEHKIPNSDVLAITGSTLVNKSLEHLLELGRDAYTIVLGPSTPMSEVLFDCGADMLAGMNVLKPGQLMNRISRGEGMLSPKNCNGEIEYVVMER
jgi:uncharacterized protein (DUF4213/DUF364 family)